MDLPKQIMGGHFTFPKQYWKGISEDGMCYRIFNFKGDFTWFSAEYCQKHYLNIFAKYIDNYH